MKIDPLDVMPIEVRTLQSLAKHSKEYKKAIKNFRFKYKVLVGPPINFKKQDERSYYYGYKYKKYLFSVLSCSIIAFIVLWVAYLTLGNFEINEFTRLQIIEFIIFTSVLVVDISAMIFFAYKVRKSMDDHIDELIKLKKIRCSHFSDDLLSSVSIAYLYTINNHKIMKTKEKCGCINCLKIFYSDEIKNHSDISVICPYCNAETIIGESSGYSIDDSFLNALKEYWIDSSN